VGEESGEGAGLPGRGARGKRWRRRAGVGAATAVAAAAARARILAVKYSGVSRRQKQVR
jgi:hypothetical protein